MVLVASSRGHLEDDVDQRRSLGDLPMDTGSTSRDLTKIDNEVPDRTEAGEDVRQAKWVQGALLTSCFGSRTPAHHQRGTGLHLSRTSEWIMQFLKVNAYR